MKAPPDLSLASAGYDIEGAHAYAASLDVDVAVQMGKHVFAPFLLQASAGIASTILLVGVIAMLIGMFATPEPLAARDQPIGMALESAIPLLLS